MSTSIDEIPTIEDAGRLGRRHSANPAVAEAYTMPTHPASGLLTSMGIAKGLELATTLQRKLFPNAEQLASLQAAGPSYTTYFDCGPYNYDATCNRLVSVSRRTTWTPSTAPPARSRRRTPPTTPRTTGTSSAAAATPSTSTVNQTCAPARTPGSGRSRANAATARSRRCSGAMTAGRSIRTVAPGTRLSAKAS